MAQEKIEMPFGSRKGFSELRIKKLLENPNIKFIEIMDPTGECSIEWKRREKMKAIIAENLKQLRIDRGIDKNILSTYLDITTSTYARYENGSRTPDLETLLAISNYYGCTINDLMNHQEVSEGVPRHSVVSYRDLRELGLNDKLSHGLVKQLIDNQSYKHLVFSLDKKVKLVYKSDVIALLTDIIEKIEQST